MNGVRRLTTSCHGLGSWRFPALALIAVALLQPVGPVHACGYEDPASVALGSLNFAYPNALHVGTAVWQAQQSGLLPRPAPASTDSSPDAAMRAAQDARLQAMRVLYQLRRRLPVEPQSPALAIVFTPAVMWSRLFPEQKRVSLKLHVSGPAPEDVVLVTEPAALAAWLDKRLNTHQLIEHGLVRLYGPQARVAAVRAALQRAESYQAVTASSAPTAASQPASRAPLRLAVNP